MSKTPVLVLHCALSPSVSATSTIPAMNHAVKMAKRTGKRLKMGSLMPKPHGILIRLSSWL